MHIGLLQCDDVAEELQPDHGNYPQMFERLLGDVEPTLEFAVWRCHEHEIPTAVDVCDVWLITGSRYGVNDGNAWIEALSRFVRELWEAHKPLVGVCFGHQLIAKALGGKVVTSERGWGVGVSFNRLDTHSKWMEPWQESLDLVVSHQDQIAQPPEGASILARSSFCPIYMMQVGQHFLGIQGHPEFTKAYSAELIERRRNLITDSRAREGLASLSASVDSPIMAQWIVNFMKQASQKISP